MHSRRTGTLSVVDVHSRGIRSLALVAAVAAASVLAGCNQMQASANRAVADDVASALPRINGSEADRSKAESSLRKALKETGASPQQQIYTKALLAQVELRSASALQSKIDANQASLIARAWEVQQLALALGNSAALSASMQKLDPSRVLASVKQDQGNANGSTDQPNWIKNDPTNIPSLHAVDADITTLNDQIKHLQSQLKDMGTQHDQMEAKADTFDQQSQQSKGDKSVKQFTQASNLRKQADDLSVKMDQWNVQLSRAQADLSVKKGQQESLTAAVHDFGQTTAQIDQNWQAIKKQAAASTAQAQAILGGSDNTFANSSAGGLTISSKAARLQQLVDKDSKLRGQAQTFVNSGIDFLNQAIKQSQDLQRTLETKMNSPEMQDKPETAAWKAMIAAIDPGQLQLQLAHAQLRRANLYAGLATELSARLAAQKAVKTATAAASLSAPDTLSSKSTLTDALTSARQSAATAYKQSTSTLDTVASGAAPDADKQAAHLASMYAYYQWSLLDTMASNKQNANANLKMAEQQRDLMSPPPENIPPALAIAPVKPKTGMVKPGVPGMATPPGMGKPSAPPQ